MVIVDQRRAGEGGGFDRHPLQAEIAAEDGQAHGGEKQQQAARKHGFGGVFEQHPAFRQRPLVGRLARHIAAAVDGYQREKETGEGKEHRAEGVHPDPG